MPRGSRMHRTDVRRVVRRVHRRLVRLRLVGEPAGGDGVDPVGAESLALAGLAAAAVLGRAALGRRAGRRPIQVGADPAPWADGTTHLVFTPTELLARLVPSIPRPRVNLLLSNHGVLAPNAPWRRAIVTHDAETASTPNSAAMSVPVAPVTPSPPVATRRPRVRPRYRSWAELMRRAFETDVLACPRCGGRMTVLAMIDDPMVITRILTHLGLSLDLGEPAPGRVPPEAADASE